MDSNQSGEQIVKSKVDNIGVSKRVKDYYFKHRKGISLKKSVNLHFCSYCGKVMWKHEKIVIVHIYTVKYLHSQPELYAEIRQKRNGINNLSNLTTSCPPCSLRKISKPNKWIFRSKHGKYYMPFIRLALTLAFMLLLIIDIIPNLVNLIR